MTKTALSTICAERHRFVIWDFGHCDLFAACALRKVVICYLGFGALYAPVCPVQVASYGIFFTPPHSLILGSTTM
jgi:hypothetical protein